MSRRLVVSVQPLRGRIADLRAESLEPIQSLWLSDMSLRCARVEVGRYRGTVRGARVVSVERVPGVRVELTPLGRGGWAVDLDEVLIDCGHRPGRTQVEPVDRAFQLVLELGMESDADPTAVAPSPAVAS